MKCNIITPRAASGPTVKALLDGHRVDDCPICPNPWPPGRKEGG